MDADSAESRAAVSGVSIERRKVRLNPQNPWPSLDAFPEDAAGFFYGRDAEIGALLERLRSAPLTVLFGVSGLGKTSLLQAGLFPRLRDQGFLPVLIRLDHKAIGQGDAATPRLDLIEQVRAAIRRGLSHPRYDAARPPEAEENLWSYFHQPALNVRDRERKGAGADIVLVFDQFEEIFIQGGGEPAQQWARTSFVEMLADLAENRVPAEVEREIERDPGLIERFDFDTQDYRIILSLREDYLAHLESFATGIPSISRSRYRLLPMSSAQARLAVSEPGREIVKPGVAQLIVDFAAGESTRVGGIPSQRERHVSPALLSLLCSELNEERRTVRKEGEITEALVKARANDILEKFYDRCFAELPRRKRIEEVVENDLLSGDEHRQKTPLATLIKKLAARGVPESSARAAFDQLQARRLVQFDRVDGRPIVELTHDILTKVVAPRRRKRERRRKNLKWILVSAVALALLLSLGAGGGYWHLREGEKDRMNAKIAEQNDLIAYFLLRRMIEGELDLSPPNVAGATLLWHGAHTDPGNRELLKVLPPPATLGVFMQLPYEHAGALRLPSSAPYSPARQLEYSPDGALLLLLTESDELLGLESGGGDFSPWSPDAEPVQSFAFGPASHPVVALRTRENEMELRESKGGRRMATLLLPKVEAPSVDSLKLPLAFTLDGLGLAVARADNTIEIYALPSDRQARDAPIEVELVSTNRMWVSSNRRNPAELNSETPERVEGEYVVTPRGKSKEADKRRPDPSTTALSFGGASGEILISARGDGYSFWTFDMRDMVALPVEGEQGSGTGVPRVVSIRKGPPAVLGASWFLLLPWTEVGTDRRQQLGGESRSKAETTANAPAAAKSVAREVKLKSDGEKISIKVRPLDAQSAPDRVNAAVLSRGDAESHGLRQFYALQGHGVEFWEGDAARQLLPGTEEGTGEYGQLALRPDGVLAGARADGAVDFWKPQMERIGAYDDVNTFALSRNGGLLVLAWTSPVRALRVVENSGGRVRAERFDLPPGELAAFAVSDEKQMRLTAVVSRRTGSAEEAKRSYRVWQAEGDGPWRPVGDPLPTDAKTCLLSADGRRLVFSRAAGGLSILDLKLNRILCEIEVPQPETATVEKGSTPQGDRSAETDAVAFSPDGGQFAHFVPQHGKIEIFSLNPEAPSNEPSMQFPVPREGIATLAFATDDCSHLFAIGPKGELTVYKLNGAKSGAILKLKSIAELFNLAPGTGVTKAFTGGGVLAIQSDDNRVRVSRAPDGEKLDEFQKGLQAATLQKLGKNYQLEPFPRPAGGVTHVPPLAVPAADDLVPIARQLVTDFEQLTKAGAAGDLFGRLDELLGRVRKFLAAHPDLRGASVDQLRLYALTFPEKWTPEAKAPNLIALRASLLSHNSFPARDRVLRDGILPHLGSLRQEWRNLFVQVAGTCASYLKRSEKEPGTSDARAKLVSLVEEANREGPTFSNDERWALRALEIPSLITAAILIERADSIARNGAAPRSGARAAAVLKEALALEPANPNARTALARTLRNSGRLEEAASEFQAALAATPAGVGRISLLRDLGYVLARKGDTEGALERIAESTSLGDRMDISFQINLALRRGYVFAEAHRWTEALAEYDAVEEFSPESSAAALPRVKAMVALGDYAHAIASLDKLLTRRANSNDVWWNIAVATTLAGSDRHENLLRAAALLEPFDPGRIPGPRDRAELAAVRGSLRARLGAEEKALADLAEAVKQGGGSEEVRLRCGWGFFHLGRMVDALEQWLKAKTLVTDDARQPGAELLAALAVGYSKAGRDAEAIDAYGGLLTVNPLYGRGDFVAASARPKAEREALEQVRRQAMGAAGKRP